MNDEGMLTIYSLQNIAQDGMMPSEQLVEVTTAYYAERQVGVTRIYAALGANHQFDKVVRCFNTFGVEQGMYAILEDGEQYQIDVCQKVIGKDAVDLTLIRVEDYYNVAEPEVDENP